MTGGRGGEPAEPGLASIHGDLIIARTNSFELIISGAVRREERIASRHVSGDGRGEEVPRTIEQLDGNAIDARFSHILHSVAVDIVPHEIANETRAAVRHGNFDEDFLIVIGLAIGRFAIDGSRVRINAVDVQHHADGLAAGWQESSALRERLII